MSVFLFGARGVDGEYDLRIHKQTCLCMQILVILMMQKMLVYPNGYQE